MRRFPCSCRRSFLSSLQSQELRLLKFDRPKTRVRAKACLTGRDPPLHVSYFQP